jgi:predicted dehydrogenase
MVPPINTALLSFGMSGTVFHAPFLNADRRFNLYGVWERSKKTAHEKYPGILSFDSLTDLLSDPQISLVIVNTPNLTHFEYTRQALLAGKHVVVEKPFTVTVAEGIELRNLARQKGVHLSIYHNRRFDSDYQTVKKIVAEGLLGNLVEAEFHFDRYKEELSAKVHKETPQPGTGSLFDLGSHLIDQALHLFGIPDAVFADIRIIRKHSQVDDYFELLLYYEKLRVRLHCSYLVREPLPAFSVHGHLGSFIKQRADPQEAALQAGINPGQADWGREPDGKNGLLVTESNGKEIRRNVPTEQGNYGLYYSGIADALLHNSPLPVTAEEAVNVIKVIEEAIASSKEQKLKFVTYES